MISSGPATKFIFLAHRGLSPLSFPHVFVDSRKSREDNVCMAFVSPEAAIKHLHFKPNSFVVDFGCGVGDFSFALSRRLNSGGGRVLAVDVQRDLLQKLKSEATHERLSNINIVWGDLDHLRGSKLADSSCDAGVAANLLFQLEARDVFAAEALRVLKPGGEILVVDWSSSFSGMGPPSASVVTAEAAARMFEAVGFKIKERFNAGSHHWGIVFEKPTKSIKEKVEF